MADHECKNKSENNIVISGLSGRFPESENVEEFAEQLFSGVDLVTDDERRWPSGIYGLPTRSGKLKNIQHFDASFFGIHAKQADAMDPHQRLMLELTFEALIDAGVNPSEVRGSKTGVFIGASSTASESEECWTSNPNKISGYEIIGCSRALIANRISYSFDFNGPSFTIDSACSSSLLAMQQAIAAMKSGQCESAIVGSVNLLFKPSSSLELYRLHMLSVEGTCKVFDESAYGYVRSEAAVAIYLQKSSVARRIYATVVGATANADGYKTEGVTYPSGLMQKKLICELFEELEINPLDVSYIEAHGTGTRAGDPEEINAVADLFCKDRKTPLLIGSVKSNIGHCEPASGLCSVAKVIIAMEKGLIPQNLHYKNPNPAIPGLTDGRLSVVTRNQPWNGGYVSINSFGFGGANAHVILKSNSKRKMRYQVEIPRIYTVSGRTLEAINYFFDKIDQTPDDDELMALIHEIYEQNIPGHNYRGFNLIGDKPTRGIEQKSSEKRPIWFIYSGMGSQWPQMGRDLLKLEAYKNSIKKCTTILKSHGIDLDEIITKSDDAAFENSFAAISAVQVALTDTLASIGIYPDGIIGHSLGESACGYADGSFTAEQTLLTSLFRGKTAFNSDVPNGEMVAVGMSWEECTRRCPPQIIPVCHNNQNNVTICGPPEIMKKFVEELETDNIFARTIECGGKAFHSKYIATAGPKLQKALDEIIPNPKLRSSKWISSSVPENEWDNAQLNSAAYHVHNFLSPVLFHEAVQHIPKNAIVIEIAPHCLLQPVLNKSLGSDCTYIGLMKKMHEDGLNFFTSNLGRLYTAGAQPKLANLYPTISYPVGCGTPMLQSMIKWNHSTEWAVANFTANNSKIGETAIEVNLKENENQYLLGHKINGAVHFPALGFLILVWKTLAKILNKNFEKLPITFENVYFHRSIKIPKEGSISFLINILESSGNFEVSEGGGIIVSGRIDTPEDVIKEISNSSKPNITQDNGKLMITTADIYKELRIRGYDYGGIFRGIFKADINGKTGLLQWNNNWISFIDTMLQFSLFGQNMRDLYLPIKVQKVVINPEKHLRCITFHKNESEQECVPISMYDNINVIKSGGIEIHDLSVNLLPEAQQIQKAPKLEKYVYVPYENTQPLNKDSNTAKIQSLTVILQTIIENCSFNPKIVELAEENPTESLLAADIVRILEIESLVTGVDYIIVTSGAVEPYQNVFEGIGAKVIQKNVFKNLIDQKVHLVVVKDLIGGGKINITKNVLQSLKQEGFILTEEFVGDVNVSVLSQFDLELVSKQIAGNKMYLLLRQSAKIASDALVVQITENNFGWVEELKKTLQKSEEQGTKVYLVAQNEKLNGLMGLMTCINLEPGMENVRSILIQDKQSETFSVGSPFFIEQLKKDLVFNVLKDGVWGTFRHILLDDDDDGSIQIENAYLSAPTDESSYLWIEDRPLSHYKSITDAELCSVYYSALNYCDIEPSTGRFSHGTHSINSGALLGVEFSGRDAQGRRVMGLVSKGTVATTVLADAGFLWEVPEKWSLQEASTIPAAYILGYYALLIRGQMEPGESILINAGTEDVSQAAIAIALQMNCTVYTTVANEAQRDFIKKHFPSISNNNIDHFSNIVPLILEKTKGRGVDLILNSFGASPVSWKCLAKHGKVLEVGHDNLDNKLGTELFLKGISFHGILLTTLFEVDARVKQKIWHLVSDGIKNKSVRPIPAIVFSENQVDQAFRSIKDGEHLGKVVIKIRDEEGRETRKAVPKIISAVPHIYMDQNKTYILVGGLGGVGLELTDWLVTRGATKIVLNSRNGIKTGYQSLCIKKWREMAITVVVNTTDVTTKTGATKLIEEANKIAPVGGIFNLAVILNDAVMQNQSEDSFKMVCRPKIDATRSLDIASRLLCPNLDYFIGFSSMSCGRGIAGQPSYGFANSAVERICEARQADGLPGQAIQLGIIGDVGILTSPNDGIDSIIGGTQPQKVSTVLQKLDYLIRQPYPVLSCVVLAEKHRNLESNNMSLTYVIAYILGIKDLSLIQPSLSLNDLGMDSIMTAEIKQILRRDCSLALSSPDIRALTFARLAELNSKYVPVL